ncbi:type II toxin-antitoxin system VapC family toxin [Rhizobium sp. CNPSo 4062]|uniref:type II toxin-antitoxin system VapC family toxin n=1 Tax=Rhizobium sp. CNPSo 4062 TaxID=3021410 RepID=UPI00254B190A|nr:type II toxin-antitoxin system VapC family toxin [Rhizobium sp. CNPSo 4062]MDK4705086.1 type II toxin-antitoxin system VapC family toxin [Rhizobium sp. CNPSo 4062]
MTTFPRIYWDTNIFIMLREHSGQLHDLLWQLLEATRGHHVSFTTSELTFSELKVRPLQQNDLELFKTYDEWSSGDRWLEIWPVSRPVLEGAALLRAQKAGLKLPDAIHVATALHVHCSHFLTADMGLKNIDDLVHPLRGKLDIIPLTILRPDEPTLTSLLKSMAE